MKRHVSTLGAFMLIAMLAVAGCQSQGQAIPNDPVEAVKLIADKQKEIKSQHLDLTLDLTLEISGLNSDDPINFVLSDFEANVTANGDVDNVNENLKLSGKADLGFLTSFLAPGGEELTFDLVKVGDTMYARAGEEDWTESELDTSTSTAEGDAANLTDFSRLLKKVAKAERLNDESIDGVDAYHFKVILDPIELISELAEMGGSTAEISPKDLAQAQDLLKDSQIDFEMWIGKSDLFIRQQKIHLKLDVKNLPDAPPEAAILAELNITTKNSKINEPVTITAPK